jgi:hypothetical protein
MRVSVSFSFASFDFPLFRRRHFFLFIFFDSNCFIIVLILPVFPSLMARVLPYWLPIHPGRWWCHCRVVYLPMAFLYGKRYSAPLDSLLTDIREVRHRERSYNFIF